MNSNKKQLLKESWLETLGNWSKTLLSLMYGDTPMVATLDGDLHKTLYEEEGDDYNGRKFVIRGKHGDVKSYASALVSEKNYLDAHVEYGETHPATVRARAKLDAAIQNFQNTTGLLWPFKDEV